MEKFLAALDQFKNKRIMVIGDVMLDVYINGIVDRISPEAPVPVVHIEKKSYALGGAGNVASNISSFGASCLLFGVYNNNDESGRTLSAKLAEANIDSHMVVDETRPTTSKSRVLGKSRGHNYQQLLRFDEEHARNLCKDLEYKLLEKAGCWIDTVDCIIFADYNKGVFSEFLAQGIIDMARENGKAVFVDPKPANITKFKGSYLVRPNLKETEEITGIRHDGNIANLEKMAKKLACIIGCKYAIVSCGEEGIFVYDSENGHKKISTAAKEVVDVTGAGDTLIAALALGTASGLNIYDAAELANYASGIVVSKVGTATATADELKKALKKV